jgi:ComF family protein
MSLYPVDSACPRCALPIEGPVSIVCRRCRRRPPAFRLACSPYRYGGELGRALRRMKYQRRPDMARDLAPLFAPALHAVAGLVDVAVPVPLHWRRASERGFNQAAELLHFAGRGAGLPIDKLSVRRVRATDPQSGLNAKERRANTARAFAVLPRRVARIEGKRVLLFDDIMTTGATMNACAQALVDAGAQSVLAFSVARAEA